VGRVCFETPLGDIWLWGDRARFESDAPVILVIAGVYGRPDAFWFRMQARMPQAAVFAAQLPGHLCPRLSKISIEAFADAFGYVIEVAFGGRPVLVCGESIGGTVALALPNPGIYRVALDPPLRTEHLWPLRDLLTKMYSTNTSSRPFLESIFGFDGQSLGAIDYMPLVKRHARVVMGAVPLMPEREFPKGLPSLVGEPEREFLASLPYIRTTTVNNAGHVMVWYEDFLVKLLGEQLNFWIAHRERSAPDWAPDDAE
jgi:pimeloyl-ACP methyl ester carboxylesterase